VLTVRVLPVAPFTIVNIVAGASHIRVRDFALGTLLGMPPGILLMTLFGGQLKDTILDPRLENLVVLMVLIALIVVGTIWASRRFADGDASKTAKRPRRGKRIAASVVRLSEPAAPTVMAQRGLALGLNTAVAAPVRVPLRRRTLEDFEREPILLARRDTHGLIDSPHGAAALWDQAHHQAVARGEARHSSAAAVTGY
jgi:SNARE associated Golgi protein